MNPSCSSRCSAGNSDPGLTTKVPPLICWMRSATPTPCRGSSSRVLRTRRSSVPFISSACCLAMAADYSTFFVFDIEVLYHCVYIHKSQTSPGLLISWSPVILFSSPERRSVVAQHHRGINTPGPTRRDVAGGHRDEQDCCRIREEHDRVGRLHVVQH